MKVHINAQGREVTLETAKDDTDRGLTLADLALRLWRDTAPAHHPTGFAAGTYADTQSVETL
jgi:hypothetical protein